MAKKELSIYAGQEEEGKRVPVAILGDYEQANTCQLLNRYTPFLFDWDKARKDAGIRPLQMNDLQ